jgi:hypothetical protein
MNLEKDFTSRSVLKTNLFLIICKKCGNWSGKYTLDLFEEEIKKTILIGEIIDSLRHRRQEDRSMYGD